MAVPRRTLTLLRKLSNRVSATTDETVRALTQSWSQAWDELSPAWRQAIAALLDEYQRTGRWPAPWQMARIEAIASAQQKTERSLAALLGESSTRTRAAVAEVSRATVSAELGVIGSQRAGLDVQAPPRSSVDHAVTARQARVAALHQTIPETTIRAVRQVLTRQSIAADSLTGQVYGKVRGAFDTSLMRASTIVRTEVVDTYRTVAGLVHAANEQILTAWCWLCSCDRTSCSACWVLHGQQFPLAIPGPDGHPACRCRRLPLTAGVTLPTAEAHFRRLTRREQIAILGPGRWELWKSGQAPWASLAVLRTNTGWRDSWTPRPVADLRRLAGIR